MKVPVSATFGALCLATTFLVALIGTLLPLHLRAKRLLSLRAVSLGDHFAAGVLASSALVHLLPSASETLKHKITSSFPVAGALALLGAWGVLVLDGAVRSHSSTHRGAIAGVLAASLSFHALLEGLALGAAVLRAKLFLALAAAVLVHKFFAALSLGAALAATIPMDESIFGTTGYNSALNAARIAALIFAGVTPLGALVALVLVERVLSGDAAKLVSSSLTAISAGVFLYVAFAELIRGHHEDSHHNQHHEAYSHQQIQLHAGYSSVEDVEKAEQRMVHFADEEHLSGHALENAAIFFAAAAGMSVLAIWT